MPVQTVKSNALIFAGKKMNLSPETKYVQLRHLWPQ